MMNSQARKSGGENSGQVTVDEGAIDEVEKIRPMPFGMLGITFLCNVLQYALFLGLTMLVLIVIRIFS